MKNKAALVVIDFINDIVNTESKVAGNAVFVAEHHVIKQANQAIRWARKQKLPIIFVKLGFSAGYPECPLHSPLFGGAPAKGLYQLHTWSSEYHPELDVRPTDISIVKHRVSAFYGTALEMILKAQKIDTIILTGVSTAMTIDHSARDAHDRDYQVIVLADACGAADLAHHEAGLLMIERIAKVLTVKELESL